MGIATTRRAALKLTGGMLAYAAGAAAFAVATTATTSCTAKAATAQIAEAERLWAFMNTTRLRLYSMTEEEDPDCEHPLWEALGEAEMKLCAICVPSPRIAEMQLWVALDHMIDHREGAFAAAERNFDKLVALKPDLDFKDKIVLSALQCVRAAREA